MLRPDTISDNMCSSLDFSSSSTINKGRGFFTRVALRPDIISACNASTLASPYTQPYLPKSRVFYPSGTAAEHHLGVQRLDLGWPLHPVLTSKVEALQAEKYRGHS